MDSQELNFKETIIFKKIRTLELSYINFDEISFSKLLDTIQIVELKSLSL